MKDDLCKAFCDELHIREVPVGLAVSTGFDWFGGEPLGFYIVGPDQSGLYHVEDDGTTLPLIEAEGADLEGQTRLEAFTVMLDEYGVDYDEERAELKTQPVPQDQIPKAAMRFVALLLRVQDLVLLTPERARSTFKEDAARKIREAIGSQADVQENESIAPNIEFPADLVVTAPGHDPVAVFFASTEQKVLEAVVAQMAAIHEAHVSCAVIALLEKDTSITRKMRRQASNRLTALPIFEGDEAAAIARIRREVLGSQSTVH